jgi:mono/diheme cytochrome c family protein
MIDRLPINSVCVLLALVGWAATVHAESVTYADLAPIFNTRCTLCHAGSSAPLGLALDSYANVIKGSTNGPVVRRGDPAVSELIRRLKGASLPRMPMTGPPFLSDAEIAKFEVWIQAGMPEGAVSVAAAEPVSTPLPGADGPVAYTHVAPIFARRCAKCHTNNGLMGAPPEGYRLTSLEHTLSPVDRARVVPGNAAASELVRRIRGDARPRMPFDGPPYLSDEEIDLIVRWVDEGARDAQGNPSPLPVGAKLRVHGRLSGRWAVDDLQLQPAARLRIDKSPVSGDYVEVRGRVMSDGTVEAERIRRR